MGVAQIRLVSCMCRGMRFSGCSRCCRRGVVILAGQPTSQRANEQASQPTNPSNDRLTAPVQYTAQALMQYGQPVNRFPRSRGPRPAALCMMDWGPRSASEQRVQRSLEIWVLQACNFDFPRVQFVMDCWRVQRSIKIRALGYVILSWICCGIGVGARLQYNR